MYGILTIWGLMVLALVLVELLLRACRLWALKLHLGIVLAADTIVFCLFDDPMRRSATQVRSRSQRLAQICSGTFRCV
jgi:hypothetical protein